jgi:hypothetical protein
MNKILPIILVVVLSGCQSLEEQYANKPFIPDSVKGGSIFGSWHNSERGKEVKKIKTYFVWNAYSQCMKQVENKETSIRDFFIDNSFQNIIECGKKKSSCVSGCTSYENKFIDFANLLSVEVKKGNLTNIIAKIELIKYQDDMVEKYKTMIHRQEESLARLEAEEKARKRSIWASTMQSMRDGQADMAASSKRLKDMETDSRLRSIENKLRW